MGRLERLADVGRREGIDAMMRAASLASRNWSDGHWMTFLGVVGRELGGKAAFKAVEGFGQGERRVKEKFVAAALQYAESLEETEKFLEKMRSCHGVKEGSKILKRKFYLGARFNSPVTTDMALSKLEVIAEKRMHVEDAETLAECYLRKRDAAALTSLWQSVQDWENAVYSSDIRVSVMGGLLQGGLMKEALAVAEDSVLLGEEGKLNVTMALMETAANAFSKNGEMERLTAVIESAIRRFRLGTPRLFAPLIELLCQKKNFTTVQKVRETMRENNVSETTPIKTTLMIHYGRAGDAQNVHDVLASINRPMDSLLLSAAVKAMILLRDAKGCALVAKKAEQLGNDPSSAMCAALFMYGTQGKLKESEELFAALDGRARFLNISTQLRAHRLMIYAYGVNGRMDRAEQMFLRMKDRGPAPDVTVYNVMMRLALKQGRYDQLESLYRELDKGELGMNHVAIETMMEYAAVKGDVHALNIWFLEGEKLKSSVAKEALRRSLLSKIQRLDDGNLAENAGVSRHQPLQS